MSLQDHLSTAVAANSVARPNAAANGSPTLLAGFRDLAAVAVDSVVAVCLYGAAALLQTLPVWQLAVLQQLRLQQLMQQSLVQELLACEGHSFDPEGSAGVRGACAG